MSSKISRRQAIKLAAVGGAALTAGALSGCTISVFSDTSGDSEQSVSMRTLDDIIAAGVLRVGITTDLRPYSYVDDLGVYQGFDVQLARRIAQDLGVGIEFIPMESSNRILLLQNYRVDMELSCFTVTESRRQKIDFATPYMQVTTGVISHAENVLTDMADIGDRPMMTVVGSMTELFLRESYPDVTLEIYDSYASVRLAFENRPDAVWATDITDLIVFASQDPDKYVVGLEAINDPMPIAAAVAKGNQTLLDWLNDELVSLGSENFFHKNYDETLLETYGPEYADVFIIEPGQD